MNPMQQQSLQKRIKISTEIHRLQNDSRSCGDSLLQQHISEIVSVCTRCTALEMEASEQLGEGLVKIGADAFTVQMPGNGSGVNEGEPPMLDREFVQLAIQESERRERS